MSRYQVKIENSVILNKNTYVHYTWYHTTIWDNWNSLMWTWKETFGPKYMLYLWNLNGKRHESQTLVWRIV